VLGGVTFSDSPVGPLGHSDGDVVCHAIADALLGAANLGDIGRHFPDTDPRWKDADSLVILDQVRRQVQEAGYSLANVDCTIITEQPPIAPMAAQMQERIAGALGVESEAVSIKATRGEGMGPEGRGECISVLAVALLES